MIPVVIDPVVMVVLVAVMVMVVFVMCGDGMCGDGMCFPCGMIWIFKSNSKKIKSSSIKQLIFLMIYETNSMLA